MAKRRIMHKFRIDEVSSVDNPAQPGAKAVIMKRDTAKLMFDEALQDLELREDVFELIDEQWKLNDALQNSIHSIVSDKETYPDPVSAVKASLSQFASAMTDLVNETEEEIEDESMKREIGKRAWQMANPDDRDNDSQKSEEGNMPKPKTGNTPTIESLTEDLSKIQEELQVAKNFGELNDQEKSHYQTLSKEDQKEFLEMNSDQRTEVLTKFESANSVIYTADDGTEYRKNDDPRLISMAKRADRSDRVAKEEREERLNLEISKRVDSELPNVPGETSHKVELYKAVEAIEDEEVKAGIFSMLKAHNELVKMALTTNGEKDSEVLKAEDELDKQVKRYQKDHNIGSFEKAYAEFLNTPEGLVLYKKTTQAVATQ